MCTCARVHAGKSRVLHGPATPAQQTYTCCCAGMRSVLQACRPAARARSRTRPAAPPCAARSPSRSQTSARSQTCSSSPTCGAARASACATLPPARPRRTSWARCSCCPSQVSVLRVRSSVCPPRAAGAASRLPLLMGSTHTVVARTIHNQPHRPCVCVRVHAAGTEVAVLEGAMHELQAEMHAKRRDAYEQEELLGEQNPPVFEAVQVRTRVCGCLQGFAETHPAARRRASILTRVLPARLCADGRAHAAGADQALPHLDAQGLQVCSTTRRQHHDKQAPCHIAHVACLRRHVAPLLRPVLPTASQHTMHCLLWPAGPRRWAAGSACAATWSSSWRSASRSSRQTWTSSWRLCRRVCRLTGWLVQCARLQCACCAPCSLRACGRCNRCPGLKVWLVWLRRAGKAAAGAAAARVRQGLPC